MKTLFIEAKYSKPVKLSKEITEKLPSRIGLISSIQFLDSLQLIKKQLLLNSKNSKGLEMSEKQSFSEHTPKSSISDDSKNFQNNKKVIIGGQILGCNIKNAEKIQNKVDAFLYIGDGQFHPLGIAIKTKKPVFTFNPLNNYFSKIKKEEIEAYERKKKSSLIKFLHAENVGILVSTKYGQYYPINKLNSIIKKLNKKYKNKKFYTFIADTIDYNQLENFPFIEAWVNTACPRIEEDIKIINIEEVK